MRQREHSHAPQSGIRDADRDAGPLEGVTQDHWTYLCFDAYGRLLYVGVTSHGIRRFGRGHGKRSAWWADVVRIDVEHHPTQEAALERERALIVECKPAHNVQHAKLVHVQKPSPRRFFARWLSIDQLAEELDEPVEWVEARIEEGLPHAVIAGNARFQLFEVDTWLEAR